MKKNNIIACPEKPDHRQKQRAFSNGVKPKKSLGQHFLNNPRILEKIVSLINPAKEDIFLEIGCGQADLTLFIAKKAGKVIAMETDRALARIAEEKIKTNGICNINIIKGDFLREDVGKIIRKAVPAGEKIRVAGNIPYNIASQIIFKLFEQKKHIKDITLLLQKEMAERITSKHGGRQCGYISMALEIFFERKRLYNISGRSFFPHAKVDSTLISLKSRQQPLVEVEDEEDFLSLIKACFAHRRKTLRNNLKYYKDGFISERELEAISADTGLDLSSRPEKMDVFQFKMLYDKLKFKF